MGFPGQARHSPAVHDALVPVTPGHPNDVNHLVLVENAIHADRLLKHGVAPVDLLRHSAAVDLDFHEVRLLLLDAVQLVHLFGQGEGLESHAPRERHSWNRTPSYSSQLEQVGRLANCDRHI